MQRPKIVRWSDATSSEDLSLILTNSWDESCAPNYGHQDFCFIQFRIQIGPFGNIM
jgi:hypothetical protein